MRVLACDAEWIISNNSQHCSGDLYSIEAANIPTGMSADDVRELTGHTLELFAIVFGLLVLKKALKL